MNTSDAFSKNHSLLVSPNVGTISLIMDIPTDMKFIITLAHGARANMNHVFMEALSSEFMKLNIGTVRFNFPYMENGKKRPDLPAVAHKTIEAVLNYTRALFPNVPLFAGGKSFGGRMTSQLLSKNPLFVKAIVFFGFPLHPVGEPSIERAVHLRDVAIPMLFLQGTKDKLAEESLIKEVCSGLTNANLYLIEGADHSFKRKKDNLLPELAQTAASWISSL